MSHATRVVPAGKSVQLMITCLCDAFYDNVARASVEVLEHAGCEIEFPEGQTCCGQPAFNSGDWDASRRVVRHAMKVFPGDKPIVLPSGSCAGMLLHANALQFEGEADAAAVAAFADRVWELSDYLVNGLGITEWPGRFKARIALHRSCHTRGTDSFSSAVRLLESIEGVELVEVGESEQCCGFGGTFSVSFPHISKQMGELKIEHLTASKPDVVAALDMACMMHFGGMMDKQQQTTRRMHVAEILLEALRSQVPAHAEV